MAGPPRKPGDPLTEKQQEAFAAYQRLNSIRAVAAELGIGYTSAQEHISAAKFKLSLSDGIKAALEDTGIAPEQARFGYRRVKHEDGSFNTVMWRMPDQPGASAADRIRAALEGMDAIPAIAPPVDTDADLLKVYAIADLHLGMRSAEYDRETAKARLLEASASLASGSNEYSAVVLIAGDFFHANDATHLTPKSKHPLDVDGSFFDTLADGVEVSAATIELAARAHREVTVVVLPGNHDPGASLALMFALAERYRDNPRIRVERGAALMWAMSWGKCLLAAHHGDDIKPDDLVHSMAEHPDWSGSPYRYLKTAHRHKYSTMMIGSVEWESMSCVTARDAWAQGKGFVTRPAMRATTYHKRRGEVGRRTVNL